MSKPVLDASALLAFLFNEPGAHKVEKHLAQGAYISAVNLCEVWSKLADKGIDIATIEKSFYSSGLGQALEIVNFDQELAAEAARLHPICKRIGLSLGDRACLALAIHKDTVAVTADTCWNELRRVHVELIR